MQIQLHLQLLHAWSHLSATAVRVRVRVEHASDLTEDYVMTPGEAKNYFKYEKNPSTTHPSNYLQLILLSIILQFKPIHRFNSA